MTEKKIKHLTVYEETHEKFKVAAFYAGMSMRKFADKLIDDYNKKKKQ
jgi:hypothetical protein